MTSIRSHAVSLAVLALAAVMSACSSPSPVPTSPAPPTATAMILPTFTPDSRSTDTPVPPTATAAATATPTSVSTASPPGGINPLTGLPLEEEKIVRRSVLVRIGNDPIIRPQTGLSAADVVFEELMEGYAVTRFTAVYLSQEPDTVGPIRSARLMALELGNQFDAALVYAGASDPVRWRLSQASFLNLDDYFHPKPFWLKAGRDWRGRLFTGVRQVRQYMRDKKLDKPVRLTGWAFDPAAVRGESAVTVDVPYPGRSRVRWRYNPAAGVYERYADGRTHTDAATGKQLTAANVIVLYARHTVTDIIEDSLGSRSIDISLTGQGKVLLFRDGVQETGTWGRKARGDLIQFYGGAGQPLKLKPGVSWIEVVPAVDFVVEAR